jgi:8-oxo-dGTP diphosphatase
MRERAAETREYGTRVGALTGWRYCPRCATEVTQDEGCVECPACGFVHYAHSSPAVSALVVDSAGRMLLGRRAHDPDAGLWDMLGGFLEEGEHPLDGLRRELLEETGLEVETGDFLGAYIDTYGEGPQVVSVLNLVWETRIVSGEPSPADDVSELRWFPRDEPPAPEECAFRWVTKFLRGQASADLGVRSQGSTEDRGQAEA